MIKVEFYRTTQKGQEFVGHVVFSHGELKSTINERLLHDLLVEHPDISTALRFAPERFDGAYLRAKLVEDVEKNSL